MRTVWYEMRARCGRKNHARYEDYGGRGIRVCDRWERSFDAFLEDMGPRPSPAHSVDRIDNDRGYEPGNCRWATDHQQARNSRQCKLTEADVAGIRQQLAAGMPTLSVAKQYAVSSSTIKRIKSGRLWSGVGQPIAP